jgi:hypothetical protein
VGPDWVRISCLGLTGLLLAGCGPSREDLVAQHASVVEGYCLDCHNNVEQVADLSLERLEMAAVASDPETWEKVVRKLRGGMMPPADGPRPDPQAYLALTEFLESELDSAYRPLLPPPGLHRMNRAEYANAVRDLLALELDRRTFCRPMIRAAASITRPARSACRQRCSKRTSRRRARSAGLRIGNVTTPTQTMYRVAEDTTQDYHVEGLPFGTRGGIVVDHYFPADAEYEIKVFSVNLGNMGNFRPFGEVRGEQLEVLLDGERVQLFDWDEEFNIGRGFGGGNGQLKTIDLRMPVSAGPHTLGITFLASNYAPLLDLNDAFERSTIETGGLPGFTFYPHIGSVRIDGPYDYGRGADTE